MDSLASNGQGRRWPLALIFIAIFISFVYLPLEYLFPSIYFNSEFGYIEIFTILTYLAPLAYIIGVVCIHLDTVAGKPERVRLFKLGGITLLIGGISGTMSYGFYFYNILSSNAQTSWDLLYTIIFPAPIGWDHRFISWRLQCIEKEIFDLGDFSWKFERVNIAVYLAACPHCDRTWQGRSSENRFYNE